jgi:hypothetical protein
MARSVTAGKTGAGVGGKRPQWPVWTLPATSGGKAVSGRHFRIATDVLDSLPHSVKRSDFRLRTVEGERTHCPASRKSLQMLAATRINPLNGGVPQDGTSTLGGLPGVSTAHGASFRPGPHDVERQETGNQADRRLAMTGTSMLSCATSSTNGPATETGGGTVLALTPLNRRKTRMASQAVRLLPSISA